MKKCRTHKAIQRATNIKTTALERSILVFLLYCIYWPSMENYKWENAFMVVRRSDTRKASLKDFNIPTKSWEQIAQDRAKWRGLIRRDAGENETKRISEAEQKRVQRKARANATPTELSFSGLSCSICNTQFRAKIGLISPLRTHKHTNNNTRHLIIQLTLAISNSLISNNRLSRSENLFPA